MHALRFRLAPFRLLAAIALAIGASCAFLLSGSLASRAEMVRSAYAAAEVRSDVVGLATMGEAYLQTAGNSLTVSNGTISRIDGYLDPAQKNGALYPLRKAMEQLAAIMLVPLLIIAASWTLLSGGTASDAKMGELGVKLITVLFLLWAYPAWDFVLYRHVTIPMYRALTEGGVKEAVMGKVAHGAYKGTAIDEQISVILQNQTACTVALVVGPEALGSGPSCPNMDDAAGALTFDNVLTTLGGDYAAIAAVVENLPPDVQADARKWLNDNKPGIAGAVMGWVGDKMADASAWVVEKLTNTIIGGAMLIGNFLVAAYLWFVWVGVLIGRAISLSLAPLAIVWPLLPTGQQTSFGTWLKGHAKIVLFPVGVAFALLVFFTMMLTLAEGSVSGNAITGFALKMALLGMLVYSTLKTGNITKLVAGDVSGFATAVGDGVRTSAVKMVGTAAAVTAGGAAVLAAPGAVAGWASSASRGFGGAAKAIGGYAKGKGLGRAGAAMEAMGEKLQDTTALRESFKARTQTPAALLSTERVANRVWRNTRGVATWIGKARTSDAAAGRADTLARESTVGAFKSAREDYEKYRKREGSDTATALTREEQQLLEREIPASRSERERLAKQEKIEDYTSRKDEDILSAVDTSGITVAGSHTARKEGQWMGSKIVGALMKDPEINLSIRTRRQKWVRHGMIHLDDESLDAMNRLMDEDGAFKAMVERAATRAFGSYEAIPKTPGASGPLPSLNEVLVRSPELMNAISAAIQTGELMDQEMFRRELLTKKLGLLKESVGERVVRDLDADYGVRQATEDGAEFKERMLHKQGEIFRIAWYINASADDRRKLGLPEQFTDANRDEVFKAVAATKAIDEASDAWKTKLSDWSNKAGSYEALEAHERDALQAALAFQSRRIDAWRGEQVLHGGLAYGLDVAKMVETEGAEREYIAQEGSAFHKITQKDGFQNGGDAAYHEAVRQIIKAGHQDLPERLKDESDENYIGRNRTALNRLVFIAPPKKEEAEDGASQKKTSTGPAAGARRAAEELANELDLGREGD